MPKANRRASHAAIEVEEKKRNAQVLEGLRRFPQGATAPMLAQALGLEPYIVRPRLTTLHKARRVWVIGKEWYPVTRRHISVYALPRT